MKDLAEIGVSAVALTGGEPFLREDIFDIIEKIMECSMGLQINTNATLMTEEVAKKLSTLPRRPSIIVGLDGASSETHDQLRGEGTFEKTIRGLTILQKYGVPFKVFTVLTKYNCHEFEEILLLAKQVGAYQIDITFVVGTGRAHCYSPEFYFPNEERADIFEEVESLSHKYSGFVGGACLQQAQRVRASREGVDMYYPQSGKLFSCGAGVMGCTIQPKEI
ncbi:TPA: radical SAM protein [Candidatus Poribacteria bacterium]|nr:radical SAM protein [Candidatus Poribacteria bacterium]